jgi:hypothetical protein
MRAIPSGGVKLLRGPTNVLAVAVAEFQIHLDATKFMLEVTSGVRLEVVAFSTAKSEE